MLEQLRTMLNSTGIKTDDKNILDVTQEFQKFFFRILIFAKIIIVIRLIQVTFCVKGGTNTKIYGILLQIFS